MEHDDIDILIDKYIKSQSKELSDLSKDCPVSDQVISYALKEADDLRKDEIEAHMATCTDCMNLFFDVRIAENLTVETREQSKSMHPEILKTIKEKRRELKTGYEQGFKNSVKKITDFIHSFLSLLFIPKRIIPLVACSLVLFVLIYNEVDTSKPANLEIMLMVKPMTTRGGEEPGNGGRMLNEGDTLWQDDNYRIKVESDADGYGYVLLAGDSGRIKLLFMGRTSSDKPIFIPGRDNWAKPDSLIGKETIYFFVSEKEIVDFDEKFRKLKETGINQLKSLFPNVDVKKFKFNHG